MNLSIIPSDIIINEIIPYTYCTQQKELLEDIANYNHTRSYLFKKYYDMYGNDNYVKDMLDNDLNRYFNEDINFYHGFLNCFFRKYKRLFKLKDKKLEYLTRVISRMGGQGRSAITLDIGIKLGILRPCERDSFVRFVNDSYDNEEWYGVWYDGAYIGNIYDRYNDENNYM